MHIIVGYTLQETMCNAKVVVMLAYLASAAPATETLTMARSARNYMSTCTTQSWQSERCCTPMFAKHFRTDKWTQLGNQTILFPKPWHHFVRHVYGIEPLSVAAFSDAIFRHRREHTSGWVLDVGVNLGWYTLLASTIAPDLRVLGVDMQPKCAEITKCGLQLNGRSLEARGDVQVLTKFVSSVDGPPIQVPEKACDTMASPSAVAGRRPDGRLRGTMLRINQTKTTPVGPILLGPHLLARAARGERVAVTKIDTEGYETRVLESLRPTWSILCVARPPPDPPCIGRLRCLWDLSVFTAVCVVCATQ